MQAVVPLIKAAPTAALIVDAGGSIQHVNDAALRLFGYDDGELVGHPVSELLPEPFAWNCPKAEGGGFSAHAGESSSFASHLTALCRDGHAFPVEVVLHPAELPSGRYAIVWIVDITERVEHLAALARSEERFRMFATSSSDWLWETDADDRFIYASERPNRLQGEAMSQYLGIRREDLAAEPTDTEKWRRYRETMEQRLPIREFVFRRRGISGQIDFVRINGVPRFDPQGVFLGYGGTARFVTEEVCTAQALEASEKRYRTLTENSVQGVLVMNRDAIILFANDAAARILGRPKEELVGMSGMEGMVHEADRPEMAERMGRRFTGTAMEAATEFRILRPDGRAIWVMNVARMIDWDGEPALQAAFIDVTELKRAQEERERNKQALESSEKRYRTLIEQSVQGVLVINDAGSVLYANEAAAHILGKDPAGLVGDSAWEGLIHPDDLGRVAERARGRFRGVDQPGAFEFRILHPRDGTRWLLSVGHLVDWDGVPAVQAAFIDVTARKRVEEETARSEQQFRQAFEHYDLPIVIARDGKDLRFVNQACARLLGYPSVADLLAHSDSRDDHIHPDDLPKLLPLRRSRYSGEPTPNTYEFRVLHRDGHAIWVRTSVAIAKWEGEPCSLHIYVDITAEKEREAQLVQSQKMEAIGQLTGGVAHDFNNLLTIIAGNLQLLQRKLPSELAHTDLLTSSMDAAHRGAALTQQLLAYSRKQELRPEPCNPHELVSYLIPLFRRTLPETVSIADRSIGSAMVIEVDINQLQMALINLVVNARDAMPAGGSIYIDVEEVTAADPRLAAFPGNSNSGYARIAVTDTGVGMSPDVQENAFAPFYTTKELGKGSGLGLSMVYGFVQQSNGHVSIQSAPGAGTTVSLYFRSTQRGNASVPSAVSDNVSDFHGSGLALVVEDDPEVRAVAVALLGECGFRSIEAPSADAAKHILRDQGETITLLISDIGLPGGMNGRELAAYATDRHPGLPIILTSGYPGKNEDTKGSDLHRFPFLSKPYTYDSFVSALNTAFGSKRNAPLEG